MSQKIDTLAHSPIGASSSPRWMACPGSRQLSEGIPATTSAAAKEGTLAHTVGELILKDEPLPANLPDDMLENVMVYVDRVRELTAGAGIQWSIEEKFSLTLIHPMMFGTADFVAYDPVTGTLWVIDYKHGAGIPVEIKDNSQVKIYGLGALVKWGVPCKKVILEIVQPRCFHPDGPIRSTELDPIDLLDFAGELKVAAKRTDDPNAPLNPGSHCRWCPAKALCPALAKQANGLAKEEFREGLSYDPVKLGETLAKVDAVEAYIAGVRAFAYSEASKGVDIPGWKLVPKRASRKWVDEDAALHAAILSNDIDLSELYDHKFKSVAQVEKVLGSERFSKIMDPHVVSISSGSNLVPESDKRKPTREIASSVFTEHLKLQN